MEFVLTNWETGETRIFQSAELCAMHIGCTVEDVIRAAYRESPIDGKYTVHATRD